MWEFNINEQTSSTIRYVADGYKIAWIDTITLKDLLDPEEFADVPSIKNRLNNKTSRIVEAWNQNKKLDPAVINLRNDQIRVCDGRHRLSVSIDFNFEKVPVLVNQNTYDWLNKGHDGRSFLSTTIN